MSRAVVKFVHATSSCARDVEGPFEVSAADLTSPEAAKAWVEKRTEVSVPLKGARRLKDGWVFFPMRKRGIVWWSVSLRCDWEQALAEAENCNCRNCQGRKRNAM